MTPTERTKLWNQSGTNTWDQSASDFDIKDLADSTNLRSTWSNKQNAISDLATIRSWASAWATAVQPWDLADIATSWALEDATGTSDNITQWATNLFLTAGERTKLWNTSWTNSWDETASTIKTKLWITTLSWSNTGDETASTIKTKLWITTLSWSNTGDETQTSIKTKLWAATSSADWYLKKEDFATFNWKQDAISDLSTIRDGAAAWATALQSGDNVSELNNDAGYLTSHQTLKTVNNQSLVWSGNVSVWTLTAETVKSWVTWTTYTVKVSSSAPASWTSNTTITFVTA